MKLKLIILFIFINLGYCIGQIPDSAIGRIADSIVISNSNHDFFISLTRKINTYGKILYIPTSHLVKVNGEYNTYPVAADSVVYNVNYSVNPISKKHGNVWLKYGLYPPVFGIDFVYDSVLYLISEPDLSQIIDFPKKLENSQFIDKKDAVAIANEYFTQKLRPPFREQLMYDRKSKIFYWAITRQKGFMRVQEETVTINAVTSDYVELKKHEYHKGFWMTINNWLNGYY